MAKYRIKLTQEEVTELVSIVNKGRHASQTYRAAYVLLNCDEGEYSVGKSTNAQICGVLKTGMRMDNFKTHTIGAFYEAFRAEEAKRLVDRLEFVFTPKHGSWLNMAEIELRVLNGQCLSRHIHTIEKMKTEVEAWQKCRNNENKKINWQFTTKDARVKLKRLYPSFEN